jgi:glycosyltransferase involved in cell wall biosynthesis
MKDRFKNVLFIGPEFNHQRGGIASVLKVYSTSFNDFNFISSYYNKNIVYNIYYYLKAVLKFLLQLISNKKIKIIHLHSASRGSFVRKSILIILAKIFRRKTVLHIHGGEFKIFYQQSGKLQFLIRYILNASNEIICLSDEWKAYFDSITNTSKSIVINNPVILPALINKRNTGSLIKVLFLNHINSKKGIFDVVDFFIKNKASFKNKFQLIIAGAGEETEKLEQLLKTENVNEIIEYKGWISGKAKDELIQECDIFILTSYNEGLPMSILESMAWGKPVIATNVGGIPRIVRPGENGWLTEPADINTLGKIFEQIQADPGILQTYGNNSLEIVQDYSALKVKEKLNEVYNYLLNPAIVQPKTLKYEES